MGPETRIETGKAIIEEIVPQALKSYQHEGCDWLGGHLWPHALSWHEVALAIACQFPPAPGFPIPLPPFTRPSYLVLFFSSYTSSFLSNPCSPVIVLGWRSFYRNTKQNKNLHCPASMAKVEGVQSHCIVSHQDGTDC